MDTSPSRRSTTSMSQTHLAPPAAGSSKPRRMTSPSLPPPSPLDLPEPVNHGHRRPPSPLRNSFTVDPSTGEVATDGDSFSGDSGELNEWGGRPTSPSVAQFAANFAQRMGSLVSNMSSRSQTHLPSDAELEAEAERERDRTRREAERILSREAEAKRLEQRVQALLEEEMRRPLPPPSIPSSTPPSPSSSNKESGGWFSAVKQKLTPTKDPLTPAQQVIQDTKARDKEIEKEERRLEKERREMEKELKKQAKKQGKQTSGEWPSSSEGKFNDPAFTALNYAAPPQTPPQPRAVTPASPTPVRPRIPATPPSLSMSPRRSRDTASPARSGPPVYAQFTPDGTLDIAATLITIAGRFEKLERWTVGHVRALEERMDDVERWLVEKEKDPEPSTSKAPLRQQQTGEPATLEAAIGELRDELAEVQGRIGELGREMAKMVTAPGNLSQVTSRISAPVARAPSTSSSIAVRSMSNSFTSPPRTAASPQAKETASPSLLVKPSASTGTRLPYPTGDYATPPDTVLLSQGAFSPTSSPPSSMNPRTRQMSISGLPTPGLENAPPSNSTSGLPSRSASPPSLPHPPSSTSLRPASASPTPRKRYTVALGGPIMSADRDRDRDRDRSDRPRTPRSRSVSRDDSRGLFSTSPVSTNISLDITDDSDSGGNDETIGKSAGRHAGLTIPKFKGREDTRDSDKDATVRLSRARPISMYSRPSSSTLSLLAPTPVTPLNSRLRSQSTDRFGTPLHEGGDAASVPITPTSGKFVDPLETRRRTQEARASAAPPPPKIGPGKPKVPVGQLVAFFDSGK